MDVISGVISCKQPCIDLASGSMDDSCSTEYAFSSPFPKAWSLALLQRFFNLLLLLPTLPFSISSTMEWNNTMRGFSCLSAEWLWQTHKSTRDKKEEIWRQQIWTHQAYKKNRRKHSPQALENGNPEKKTFSFSCARNWSERKRLRAGYFNILFRNRRLTSRNNGEYCWYIAMFFVKLDVFHTNVTATKIASAKKMCSRFPLLRKPAACREADGEKELERKTGRTVQYFLPTLLKKK